MDNRIDESRGAAEAQMPPQARIRRPPLAGIMRGHQPTATVIYLVLLVAPALILGTAYGLEAFGGLAPCPLCLRQRIPYWIGTGLAAIGLLFALRGAGQRGRDILPLLAAAIGLTFAVSAVLGLQHVGVEEGWKGWLFQVGCASGAAGSITDLLSGGLSTGALPSCGTKTPFLFGLTLAAYNLLLSLGMTAAAAGAAYLLWAERKNDGA